MPVQTIRSKHSLPAWINRGNSRHIWQQLRVDSRESLKYKHNIKSEMKCNLLRLDCLKANASGGMLITLAGFVIWLAGCGDSMERVPSSDGIRNHKVLSPFLLEAVEIRGVYQNLDVDSVVFSYTTSVPSADQLWERLDSVLKDSAWREIDGSNSIRRYERRFSKGKVGSDRPDTAMFSSAEEIRIGYTQGRVIIAYVQADSSKEDTSFAATSEAKWAETVIWPKFEALLK